MTVAKALQSTCELVAFFRQAEAQLAKKGKSGEQLEKAAEVLMSMFRVCASDK